MLPPIASRFVAGETAAEALQHARELDERGIGTILNRLGEHYTARGPADEDAATYRGLLDDIAGMDVDACVSVKPSQLGLDVSAAVFRENLGSVVGHAAPDGVVWVDMEDHTTTDPTLDAVEELMGEHPGCVGVCVQANLKRTRGDLERLATLPGKVRLVKGAYDPPDELTVDDVDAAYEELLAYAFGAFEDGIAVGSHDPHMIDRAIALGDEHGTGFEIQMLMGVREEAQTALAREYDVYQYVPYGPEWFAYFRRRVTERKENALFALRALLGR